MRRDKAILKFDVGADGFKKMIYLILAVAMVLLIVGGYFVISIFVRLTSF